MVVNIIPRMAYPNIKSHVGWYLDRIGEIELIERKGNCIPVSICLDKRKIGIRYWWLFNEAEQFCSHSVYGIA